MCVSLSYHKIICLPCYITNAGSLPKNCCRFCSKSGELINDSLGVAYQVNLIHSLTSFLFFLVLIIYDFLYMFLDIGCGWCSSVDSSGRKDFT